MPITTWIDHSFTRIFPNDAAGSHKSMAFDMALNETISFQVAAKGTDTAWHEISCAVAQAPDGWDVRIRKEGYIPVQHLNTGFEDCLDEADHPENFPGYVPDPLFDCTSGKVGCGENIVFWVTVKPVNAVAGKEKIVIAITDGQDKPVKLTANLVLHDITLQPRKDFNITHWFYADSIFAFYKLQPWSEEHWAMVEKFVKDYAGHGLDTLYVPAFTPPLDGVKLPTQLIGVTKLAEDAWKLDWSYVERWLDMALHNGITHFEWCHPFTQWGVKYAIRIYEGHGEDETLIFPADLPATSDLYRKFLTQYFGEMKAVLEARNLLDKTFFHISDEPHGDEHLANYEAAKTMVRSIAPWMQTMDALTDIRFARQHLTDMPVPSIRTALDFYNEGITSWCYYCCGPRGRYLNRLLDTPLAKIAMHGILFYRWPFKGFLHWGFNYWFRSQTRQLIDVFTQEDGCAWPNWAYGDTLQVYPGPEGPIDSMRWEVFSQSLQDYRLMQTLDIKRDDPLLKKVVSFCDFPKDANWRLRLRKELFKRVDK